MSARSPTVPATANALEASACVVGASKGNSVTLVRLNVITLSLFGSSHHICLHCLFVCWFPVCLCVYCCYAQLTARIRPAPTMASASTEPACAKRAGRALIAPRWMVMPCNACLTAPLRWAKVHLAWSFTSASAPPDGLERIARNRLVVSTAVGTEGMLN